MNLIDRVLTEPEFAERPPLLVDVGAAGGVPRVWQRLAPYAVVLAFEPDARESTPLTREQQRFRRWIYFPAIVTAEAAPDARVPLHLTRAPQCSSTLRPRADRLGEWAFASFFEVMETREFAATTLPAALAAHGLPAPDWLKIDTQGTDLRLFLSLGEARERVLSVEFEPGLIDAYEGEDTLTAVLQRMETEPFRLTRFSMEGTAPAFSRDTSPWYRRLAPQAPGWANLSYVRHPAQQTEALDRRAHLLLWVITTLQRQPAWAYDVAERGGRRFGGELFERMKAESARQIRGAQWRNFLRWLWRRFVRQ